MKKTISSNQINDLITFKTSSTF